ncbi:Gfo/Idh/MocA family protein [Acidipila sp. EB88]|uniref:Gfo/Idh/MocA family protein n=1 Tax=Acidipila sp. EB88 TaxID=2305226 RepID=UPI000F5FF92E|nr:Gfo/Idh/MocA family oxidoreductase [Acidipila sp. EB88]RRA49567.1 gfo/Idh/MocA family oxidoreductase [Acidipila sp. EB88]
MNRRDFIEAASLTALASSPVARAAAPAAKPLRLGVIGAGSRGQEDMRQFLRVPGVSISAICDIYPSRTEQVRQLVGHDVPATTSYAELLSRHDVDAVLIASPVGCHAEHIIAAARSGRPIFGEKALGFTVEQNHNIVDEVERAGVLFQIGHEYRYASWVKESVRRIQHGDIGKPTHIYAYWNRNNDWRRAVPSPDPGRKLEHLINWRLYRDTSGGLGTELGSHHIDIANWIFGEQPESVLGTSSVCVYHDGRTVGDNVQLVFNYSQGRRLMFSSLTDNAKNGNELWVYGTEGSAQITIEDATFYYEKKLSNQPTADKPTSKTIVERGVVTGASYSTGGEMPYRGVGERVNTGSSSDPTLESIRSFVEAVRGEHAVVADLHVGFRSGIACSVAHDAVFAEQRMSIPQYRGNGGAEAKTT